MAKKKRLRKRPRRQLEHEPTPQITDEEFLKLYRENVEKEPGGWTHSLIIRYSLSRSEILADELRKVYDLVAEQYPQVFEKLQRR